MTDITAWKNVNVYINLLCDRLLNPALTMCPNPRYIFTKFERQCNFMPMLRSANCNSPTQQDGIQIAFDHRTYKFMLIYATTITHLHLPDSTLPMR